MASVSKVGTRHLEVANMRLIHHALKRTASKETLCRYVHFGAMQGPNPTLAFRACYLKV